MPFSHEAYSQWWLPVDKTHRLYIQQAGNPHGQPALVLHGGPGSGCHQSYAKLFSPKHFHIILMDQRGAGKSTPTGCLQDNTLLHLIEDIETLRKAINVKQWMLVGGSWGATLALAYAQKYPEAVSGMILRSVFLGTQEEIKRAFIEMPKHIHPEAYTTFINYLSPEERHDPLSAYYQRLLSEQKDVATSAALIWHDYERILSELIPNKLFQDNLSDIHQRQCLGKNLLPKTPRMEAHYFQNDCFLLPDQIVMHMATIAQIPATIIQARYDLLCTPQISTALSKVWPAARLVYLEGAGHSQSDPIVFNALHEAINGHSGSY